MEDPVTIGCGENGNEVWFQLERSQACSTSRYLAKYFVNKATSKITIRDVNPGEFSLFRDWICGPKTLVASEENACMREPWLSNTAQAWLLGQRLEAQMFQKFCLEKFIDNCALAALGPWKIIEEKADAKSPLRRFSNHWIAWDASLVHDGSHEYGGLKAVSLAKNVDEYTGDPRNYDQEHWYSDCADQVSPRCGHNPRVIAEKKEQAQCPEKPAVSNECSFELPRSPRPKHLTLPRESRHKLRIKDSGNSLYAHHPQGTQPLGHQPSRKGCRSSSPISVRRSSQQTSPESLISYKRRGSCNRKKVIVRCASSFLLGACLATNLALCIEILPHGNEGANTAIIAYSTFCVASGIICAFLVRGISLYVIFALADGVAMAVHTASCCKLEDSPVCPKMRVLAVFVWLSIPVACGHGFVWLREWEEEL